MEKESNTYGVFPGLHSAILLLAASILEGTLSTPNCFLWGGGNVRVSWLDHISFRVTPKAIFKVTWIKHKNFRESQRDSEPPSGGSITTDRCLTHIRDAAHSESTHTQRVQSFSNSSIACVHGHVRWEGTSQRHKSTCYTVMLQVSTKNRPMAELAGCSQTGS